MCSTQKMVIFQMFYFIKKENTNNKTNQQCFLKPSEVFPSHTPLLQFCNVQSIRS